MILHKWQLILTLLVVKIANAEKIFGISRARHHGEL